MRQREREREGERESVCVRERRKKRSIKCSRPLLQKESRVKRNEEIENKKGKGLDLILHILPYTYMYVHLLLTST